MILPIATRKFIKSRSFQTSPSPSPPSSTPSSTFTKSWICPFILLSLFSLFPPLSLSLLSHFFLFYLSSHPSLSLSSPMPLCLFSLLSTTLFLLLLPASPLCLLSHLLLFSLLSLPPLFSPHLFHFSLPLLSIISLFSHLSLLSFSNSSSHSLFHLLSPLPPLPIAISACFTSFSLLCLPSSVSFLCFSIV